MWVWRETGEGRREEGCVEGEWMIEREDFASEFERETRANNEGKQVEMQRARMGL